MVEVIDFDDLPEDDIEQSEKTVNITIKVTEDVREMFSRISKRERRNMSALGAIVVEKYIQEYTENYKKTSSG